MPHSQNPHILLSIADMARHFTLPESSIRYYCKRFESFLPSIGEGRKRRFYHEALAVIQSILEEMPKLRTAKAVEEYLLAHYSQTVNVETISFDTTVRVEGEPCASGGEVVPSTSHIQNLSLPMNMNASEDSLPQLAMHILDRQTQALDSIAASLDALLRRQESLDALAQRAEVAETEAQSLRQELKTVRSLVASSEQIQQADIEQIRTWVARILQKRTD